ncbi:MAG: PAS domain-containing protein [bacterium]|nr:PAS domain-containing protein [bacterium]
MNPANFKGFGNRGKTALTLLIVCLVSAALINIVYMGFSLYRNSKYLLLLPVFAIVLAIAAFFFYMYHSSHKDSFDEERLRILSIIESALKFARKGFILCNKDLRIIRLSGAIHKMTGFYLNEGNTIQTFSRLLDDKDAENLSKAVSSVFKGYEIQNIEVELHPDETGSIWLSLDITPVHVNSFDEYDGFFMTVSDITERHALEERRDLIYHLNHVLATDEGDRNTLNNACKVVTRLHPDSTAVVFLDKGGKLEIAGIYATRAGNPDDALAEETIKAGHTLIRHPFPDKGSETASEAVDVTVPSVVVSIPLISGTDIPGVIQVAGSINESLLKQSLPILELSARMLADFVVRHENRKELRRLSMVVKRSMEGILLLDCQGTITYANDALLTLLNAPAADVMGQEYQTVFDIPGDKEDLLAHLRKDGHLSGEMKLRRRGGGTAVTLTSIFAVQESTGGPEIFAALLTDITNSAARDAELRRQQMQMIHADRLSMLGSLVANLSDSIRQPLTAISLAASLAMESSQANNPAYRWSKVEEIKKQVRQIENTIRNINLLVSNQDSPEEDYDPAEIVRNTVHVYQRLFQADSIRVDLRTGPALPLIRGRGMRVFQLLSNLLMHSYEAVMSAASMNDGVSRMIDIDCEYAPDIRSLIISVCHRGTHIRPASLIRLFDNAEVPPKHGKEEFKHGLSLSICEEIAVDLGGHLSVESREDGSIRITVNLPADNNPTNLTYVNDPISPIL